MDKKYVFLISQIWNFNICICFETVHEKRLILVIIFH